jgi:hypothetical protein
MVPAIFTLDVGGRPVLAFEARNLRESWEICHEQWMREDLTELRSKGLPLWDGKARLRSRYAAETETEVYRQAAQARDGESTDDMLLVYLVELDTIGNITAT